MAIFSELKIADFPGLCVASPRPDCLKRRSGLKLIEQNVPGGLIFSGYSTMYMHSQ